MEIPVSRSNTPQPDPAGPPGGNDRIPETGRQSGSAAVVIAIGILASRIVGLLRERAIAYYFGVSAHADVFQTAFRGPNLLQNLLGEGTISAAFIPIYSRMLAEGKEQEAGRFAGAIFSLLFVVAAGMALLGIVLAEPIVAFFAPGFVNDAQAIARGEMELNRFEVAVQAVRIIFPMTGVLVLSAWALGVLNSHRKFLIPYLAPVAWNIAIIAALYVGARYILNVDHPESTDQLTQLLLMGCTGALIGGILQLLVQIPSVLGVLRGFRLSLSARIEGVRGAMGAFGPVVAARGVYQLSAYLDQLLASFLAVGALSALRYAQILYMLPISLFGMSVAASELPELARIGSEDIKPFTARLERSLRQMMFLTIPTVVGYLMFGYLLVGGLYQTGNFGAENTWLVYFVLGAYTLGLAATTATRLFQNACYALHDTRTPARIAMARVIVATILSVGCMYLLDSVSVADVSGIPEAPRGLHLGAAGLALGSVGGAWLEFSRLRKYLYRRLEQYRLPWTHLFRLTGIAVASGIPAFVAWWIVAKGHMLLVATLVLGVYGTTYLVAAYLMGLEEMNVWTGQITRRFKRRLG